MKRTIISFIIPFLIPSMAICQGQVFIEFHDNINQKAKVVHFPKREILNPIMIACSSHVIALSDIFKPTFLSLYDYSKEAFIGHYLQKRMGPDDVSMMTTFKSHGDEFYFWDINKRALSFVKADAPDHIARSISFTKVHPNLLKVYKISEDRSLATGAFPDSPFAILDNTSNSIINFFGVYPYDDFDNKLTDKDKANQCSWYIHYEPSKMKMVAAALSGEFITFYDMKDLNNPTLIKKKGNLLPAYNGSRVSPDNIYSFIDVTGNSKFCVALYWGKTRKEFPHPDVFGGNKLLIYDWNGNPIKTIQLNHIYIGIAAAPNSEKVFLVRKDIETKEFLIESIDLK